jgi:anti-sigma-K factor RskA
MTPDDDPAAPGSVLAADARTLNDSHAEHPDRQPPDVHAEMRTEPADLDEFDGEELPHVDPRARLVDSAGPADFIDLSRSRSRWRAFAAAATALAAGLAAVVVIDRLPTPARETGRYLAVVDADGAPPAMIVDVDIVRGLVTVRSLALLQPAGRALELWAVPEGGQPVSLGVIDPAVPVVRIRPERAGVIPTRGRFTVTAEDPGGSQAGSPTGDVLYSGTLFPAVE